MKLGRVGMPDKAMEYYQQKIRTLHGLLTASGSQRLAWPDDEEFTLLVLHTNLVKLMFTSEQVRFY